MAKGSFRFILEVMKNKPPSAEYKTAKMIKSLRQSVIVRLNSTVRVKNICKYQRFSWANWCNPNPLECLFG